MPVLAKRENTQFDNFGLAKIYQYDKIRGMKLSDYLKTLSIAQREEYAKNCKTSVGYLRLVAGGHRTTKHWRVELLERYSGSAVTRHDLYEHIYGKPPEAVVANERGAAA